MRCEISPSSIRAGAAGARAALPHFQIYAEIDSTVCALDKPLTGKVALYALVSVILFVRLSPVLKRLVSADPRGRVLGADQVHRAAAGARRDLRQRRRVHERW